MPRAAVPGLGRTPPADPWRRADAKPSARCAFWTCLRLCSVDRLEPDASSEPERMKGDVIEVDMRIAERTGTGRSTAERERQRHVVGCMPVRGVAIFSAKLHARNEGEIQAAADGWPHTGLTEARGAAAARIDNRTTDS